MATCTTGAKNAGQVLKAAGFTGGVIVHVGCGDGALTVDLAKGGNTIIQGLDTSAENVAIARETIAKHGIAGRATARVFDGKNLPFIDGMVNLIVVASAKWQVASEEIERVLAPRGVVMVSAKVGSMTPGLPPLATRHPPLDPGWKAFRRPVPTMIDDWTHFHHNPAGTMVGNDTVVGPPRRIQWMGGPKWLRNHDFMASLHAMVSANGRVFYIIDEGLRNHIFLPDRWTLIARDGFNGTILWKKPLPDWQPSNWPLKSGPGHLPRRLVAIGDTVYVTAGLIQPVSAIDAVTGKTIRTYGDTEPTEELIVSDGVLFALVDPHRKPPGYTAEGTSYKEIGRANSGWAWNVEQPARCVVAVETDSGKVLWRHDAKVAPLTLTATDRSVFFHNGTGMVALDRKTGKQVWASEGPAQKKVVTGGSLRVSFSDGVVVFAGGTKLTAFDATDGKQLWTGKLQKTSHHCPEDLFIIDGLIWSPNTGKPQHTGTHFKVMDLHTGEVKKDFVAKNLPGFPMHPRCYPSRATKRHIMMNGMGTEFYEIGGDSVDINNMVRGSCIYGVMPCNGLLYKPPDTCACYYQSKLEYLCALAPAPGTGSSGQGAGERLEKGSAYGANPQSAVRNPQSGDWPMYRCDAERSGASTATVPSKLSQDWSVQLSGKLTQPVVAFGKAFVSSVDSHTLHALDAASGKEAWRFTADGRIDSAPTLYNGTVLFGCADGRVYCLRETDGALVWRYRVAPQDRQIISYQRLESVWPVHGCVLLVNDTVYALAGRNMFFDGGMRLVLLDPATGNKVSETILDENDPATGKNLQTLISAKYMPIANRDILSSDGERVYMREQNFDMKGKRIGIAPTQGGRGAETADRRKHLFCQTGLLDDVWFHRSYWIYGSECGEGWGAYAGPRRSVPCGRIMVFDESRAYAFRSDPLGNMLHPRTKYTLYAAAKDPTAAPAPAPEPAPAKGKRKRRPKGARGIQTHWKMESPPLLVNAMALGGKNLFVAGPPDVADETKMLGFLPGAKDEANAQLRAQNDAWQGKSGGLLQVVSAETGEKLAEYKLDSYPVFDGISVADGRLYMSLRDGKVACYAGR